MGLEYLHRLGITHGDMKGVCPLLDLQLSRWSSDRTDPTGTGECRHRPEWSRSSDRVRVGTHQLRF
jgi:hypothetical protein